MISNLMKLVLKLKRKIGEVNHRLKFRIQSSKQSDKIISKEKRTIKVLIFKYLILHLICGSWLIAIYLSQKIMIKVRKHFCRVNLS